MSDFIVGLTGGIGSGKSTVANGFAELGVSIVDADVIARDVVMPGSPALNEIKKYFGTDILTDEGELNRGRLRQLIFDNEQHKLWLNNLLHPQIRQLMQARCRHAKSDYVLLVVPLLIENNLIPMVNHVLVVDVDEQSQIQRTMARDNVSEQQVHNILASQASRQQRLTVADDVILNNQSTDDLQQQISELHQKYLHLAKKHAKA